MLNMIPFGQACKLQNGKAFKPSDWVNRGIPIVRIQNLNDETKPFNYCITAVEERFHIDSGDLLFSWSGTPGTSFGAFFWNRGEAYLNQHIFKVTVDSNKVDKNYLRYAINSKLNQIIDQAHGGVGLKHITKGKLEAIEIPLPSLPEQKRIAAILDKADAIRRKRQQAIDLADEFLRSVFLEMFGDPVTNPKGWDLKPISDIAVVTTGNTPSRKIPENYGSHIEWIKSDNINTPKHYLTKASEYLSEQGIEKARVVSKGAILMTCIAGSKECIGNAAITNRDVSFNQQINALTPKNNSTTEYLYSIALFGKKLIQSASTNGMKGMVSKGKLEKLNVPVPPIELKEKYSKHFQKYLKTRNRLNESLGCSKELFNSLSQQAFAGKL